MTAMLREALANFAGLIDPKMGPIRSVELVEINESDPQAFMAHATPCDTTPLTDMPASNRGAACSYVRDRAVIRACGESIERYCSAIYDPMSLLLASPAELRASDEHFIHIGDIYPFLDTQYTEGNFPFQPVTEDTRIRWVSGGGVDDSQPVWLPASCVYVPYLFDHAVEPWTHMPISTGLAAGPSLDSCVKKGIYEILERDALMLRWAGRIEAQRIDVDSCRGLAEEIDGLLRAGDAKDLQWHISLLTLDVEVPILSAALVDTDGIPKTSFGISSSQDIQHALLLAIEEAVLTRMLVNRSDEARSGKPLEERDISTLRDHLMLHAVSSELRQRSAFLLDDGPLKSFDEVRQRFEKTNHLSVLEKLAAAGLRAYWTDVTTDDVRDCNIHVTRVVIPYTQPLDNDHRFRYLGGRRLLSVPRKFGSTVRGLMDLNPDPHPFP